MLHELRPAIAGSSHQASLWCAAIRRVDEACLALEPDGAAISAPAASGAAQSSMGMCGASAPHAENAATEMVNPTAKRRVHVHGMWECVMRSPASPHRAATLAASSTRQKDRSPCARPPLHKSAHSLSLRINDFLPRATRAGTTTTRAHALARVRAQARDQTNLGKKLRRSPRANRASTACAVWVG